MTEATYKRETFLGVCSSRGMEVRLGEGSMVASYRDRNPVDHNPNTDMHLEDGTGFYSQAKS